MGNFFGMQVFTVVVATAVTGAAIKNNPYLNREKVIKLSRNGSTYVAKL